MTPPNASMTSSRRAPAWAFSTAARSSTKPAPPAEMHPGLHARCVRVPVRHCAEETRRRLVRDNPAPLRPQAAPASSLNGLDDSRRPHRRCMPPGTHGIHTTGAGAEASPRKTTRRRRTCTLAVARGPLFRFLHRLPPGSGSQPPVPQCKQPAARPGSTAPPSAGEGTRTPTTHRPDAEPGPAEPQSDRVVAPERVARPAPTTSDRPGRSARSSAARSSATASQHDTRDPGPPGGGGPQPPSVCPLNETPTHGQAHGGDIYQALIVLRLQGGTPCPPSSLS